MNEVQLRELPGATGDLTWEITDKGVFTYCGPGLQALLGYSPGDLIGRRPFDFMPPDEAARMEATFARHLASRQPFTNLVFIALHRSGRQVVVKTNGVPFFDDAGALAGYRGVDRVITGREHTEQALIESEERFRNVIWASPMGIHIYRLEDDGRLIFTGANPAADRLLGVPNSQFVGKTIEEAFPPLAETEVPDRYRAAAQHGEIWQTRQLDYEDDQIRGAFEVHAFQTSPRRMAVMFMEVTDRLRSEAALKASEEKHRTLFETMGQGVVYQQSDGRIMEANPAAERILGLTLDQMQGRTSMDPRLKAIHEDGSDFPGETHPAMVSLATGEPSSAVMGVFNPIDEDYRWILVSATPLFRQGAERPDRVFSTFTDITERRKTERQFQQRQLWTTAILDAVPDMVYEHTLDGRIIFANKAASEFLGWPVDRVGEITLQEILADGAIQQVLEDIRWLVSTRRPLRNREYGLKDAEGREFQVEASAILLERDDRGPTVLGVARDISARKQEEQERTLLEAQLQQAQKLEALGRLAGGVAHDFNNILTGINGFAEMIKRALNPQDPLHADITEILRAGQRASELTNQLLAFSRKQIVVPRVVQPNDVLSRSKRMLARIIGEDISLSFEAGADLWCIRADPAQLDQVLINLAVNSRDAMPRGGKLAFRTANRTLCNEPTRMSEEALTGDFVLLEVTDTGQGMSEEVVQHIFEPFFSTKSNEKGTGLGLSTVYGIVKQNNGQIAVQSREGQGTTFRIYFPAIKETADESRSPDRLRLPEGDETILLVEDEHSVRRLAKKILQRQGYEVLEAANGLDACAVFENPDLEVHLLLTDVVMPGMSGVELYQRLRLVRPDLKVVLMSGYTDDSISHPDVLQLGIKMIHKPFSIESLVSLVREVLDQHSAATPN